VVVRLIAAVAGGKSTPVRGADGAGAFQGTGQQWPIRPASNAKLISVEKALHCLSPQIAYRDFENPESYRSLFLEKGESLCSKN
jgi:hypothetical protein